MPNAVFEFQKGMLKLKVHFYQKAIMQSFPMLQYLITSQRYYTTPFPKKSKTERDGWYSLKKDQLSALEQERLTAMELIEENWLIISIVCGFVVKSSARS